MSVMSDLSSDIQARYAQGASVRTIAAVLQIPVYWVTAALTAAADLDQQIADNDYFDDH